MSTVANVVLSATVATLTPLDSLVQRDRPPDKARPIRRRPPATVGIDAVSRADMVFARRYRVATLTWPRDPREAWAATFGVSTDGVSCAEAQALAETVLPHIARPS